MEAEGDGLLMLQICSRLDGCLLVEHLGQNSRVSIKSKMAALPWAGGNPGCPADISALLTSVDFKNVGIWRSFVF